MFKCKGNKVLLYLSILIFLSVLLFPSVEVDAATVKMNVDEVELFTHQTYKLDVLGTTKETNWVSSNTGVVTVSKTGKVAAKKKGVATVSCSVGGKKYTANVRVTKNFSEKVLLGHLNDIVQYKIVEYDGKYKAYITFTNDTDLDLSLWTRVSFYVGKNQVASSIYLTDLSIRAGAKMVEVLDMEEDVFVYYPQEDYAYSSYNSIKLGDVMKNVVMIESGYGQDDGFIYFKDSEVLSTGDFSISISEKKDAVTCIPKKYKDKVLMGKAYALYYKGNKLVYADKILDFPNELIDSKGNVIRLQKDSKYKLYLPKVKDLDYTSIKIYIRGNYIK